MVQPIILATVGFKMPLDFPLIHHNSIASIINKYKESHKIQWTSFNLGWVGLAYRYRAMVEYDEQFTSYIRISASPSPEERYAQSKSLFGFFTNGLSTLECLFFSMYCIGAILDASLFPISKDKDLKFYPEKVISKFMIGFNNDALSNEMKALLTHNEWIELENIRNVLRHRVELPRTFYKGGDLNGMTTIPANPKAIPNQWQFDFSVNDKTTALYRAWLVKELTALIVELDNFCKRKL